MDLTAKSGRRMRTLICLLTLVAVCAFILIPALSAGSAAPGKNVKYAGTRSSAYGIRPFPTPEGWTKALTTMSGYFPGSTPVGVWIVGRLHGKSTGVNMEFPKPNDGVEYGPLFNFQDTDKHEPFLKQFDDKGIKVFLQVEPGFADMEKCIDLVMKQYKHHKSVVGFGVDVEWFQNAKTGTPNAKATDELVKAWEKKVKSYNKNYRLFVKHFATRDLPPKYRGDVVFVNDSQQIPDLDSFLKEYKEWAEFFYPNMVMYQVGYRADKKWWGELPTPPKTLGEKLAAQTRQDCAIIWVDFTLRDVLPTE